MNKYFCPQPDITAYELARIVMEFSALTRLRRIEFTDEQWETLPKGIARHFGSAPMPPLI